MYTIIAFVIAIFARLNGSDDMWLILGMGMIAESIYEFKKSFDKRRKNDN